MPCIWRVFYILQGPPGSSADEESACNAGDPSSIPGLGRSPGEGISYPLQYSGLRNSMDRGAWWATVHVIKKSRTQLSDFHFYFTYILQSLFTQSDAFS